MPFNNDRNGFVNEIYFIKRINNKKYLKLDYQLQRFISDLYDKVNEDSKIRCYKNKELQKYDILINIDDNIKRVSIKKGVKNFVHFLIENKMPRELVIWFLKYHYAAGTTNGSGWIRISIEEYKQNHQKEIDDINKFINQEYIIKKAIDRFIIFGRNSNEPMVSLKILYGLKGIIYIKYYYIYKRNLYSTAIHFSNLTYQPLSRCINGDYKYEKDRFISQIKWYNISDDIIEIMNMDATNL